MSYRNSEGYSDPTAGQAFANIRRQERNRERAKNRKRRKNHDGIPWRPVPYPNAE